MGWKRAEVERAKRMSSDWRSARVAATKAIEARVFASRLRKGLTNTDEVLNSDGRRGTGPALQR